MPVSREEVIHGFRMILGRDPETEADIAAHTGVADATALARVLLKSAEFRRSGRFAEFLSVRGDAAKPETAPPHAVRARMRVLLVGNCQVAPIGRLMQAMAGDVLPTCMESTPAWLAQLDAGHVDLGPALSDADVVFVQMVGTVVDHIRQRHPRHAGKIRQFPPINYSGFHPDAVYIERRGGGHLQGPMGDYHSSLAFWAWKEGWSESEALSLYAPQTYEGLAFDAHHEASARMLLEHGRRSAFPLGGLLQRWAERGAWMHTVNHPVVSVLADVAAELLRREGVEPMRELASYVDDSLAWFPAWPLYPPIARRLGLEGSYLFKLDRSRGTGEQPQLALSLDQFVHASYECYACVDDARSLRCPRVETPAYARLASLKPKPPSLIGRLRRKVGWAAAESLPPDTSPANPYAGLPDHRFWRRAVQKVEPAEVDPVIRAPWRIAPSDRVATAGSCFAQHLSRTLKAEGFRHFVTEAGEGLPAGEAASRQFGVFSARYGNVYTVRQLVQLVDRAYGDFIPADVAWRRPDGRFVDPFRPEVEPGGYASADEVLAARDTHLAAVRRLLEQMDVFVFTLGLTEAWRNRADGAVYPLAPGVVAGAFDEDAHEFVNFSAREVRQDILAAAERIRGINPEARLMFTVSPVPLIATYEDRHVLVSTVESKAILRTAIGEAVRIDPAIAYFPSYEIVSGAHGGGRYFASDLRSVTDEGVAHVMRVFLRHYAGIATAPPAADRSAAGMQELIAAEHERLAEIVCDEEAIDRARLSPPAA